jgi:hypothetical protein
MVNPIPAEWISTENYRTFDLYCNISFEEIVYPAYLIDKNGNKIVVD